MAITNPTDIPNLVAWYDGDHAASFTFHSGVLVSAWTNRSGAAASMTQGTSGDAPSRNVTSPTGRTAVRFSSKSMISNNAGLIGGTGITYAVAVRRDGDSSAQSGRIVVGWRGGGNDFDNDAAMLYDSPTGFPAMYRDPSSQVSSSPSTAVGDWAIVLGVWDGTNFNFYVNGTNTGTVATSGTFAIDNLGMSRNAVDGERGDNSLAEVAIYSRALDSTERSDMTAYLTTKWLGSGGTPITKTPADNLGLTDAVTRARGRNLAPADNLGLTDAAARSVGRARAPADNLGLVDAAARSVGRSRAPADQLGLNDAMTRSLSLSRITADQLGLTDTVAASIGRAVAPTDQLSLTDALTVERALARALSDPLGLTDGVSLVVSRTLSPGDTLGLTDTVTVRLDLQRSSADVLGLTDGITLARTVHVGLSDQLGLVDNAFPVISGQGTQQVADVLSLTDAVTLTRSVHLTVGDQLGLVDAVARARNLNRLVSDQLGLTDAAVRARTILRQLNDQLGLTDLVTHGAGGPARLFVGDDPVTGVRYGDLVVSAIFVGTVQVWP